MVKHQRRSHQRGFHGNDIYDDCSSDSDTGEFPSTPTASGMSWQRQDVVGHLPQAQIPRSHVLQRSASFADFGQNMNYAMQPSLHHRNSLPGVGPEYRGPQVHTQSQGVPLLHRSQNVSGQTYYISATNQPGVLHVANNLAPQQRQYHIDRPQVDRTTVEVPYSAPGINPSVQSSPSAFSPADDRSPSMQEGFYTHQPTQAATYALHDATREHQRAHAVQCSSQVSQHIISAEGQTASQRQDGLACHGSAQFRQPASPPEPQHWYQYQAPVEVTTIGQLPTFNSTANIFDFYGEPKLDFEDPSMVLPSARLQSL